MNHDLYSFELLLAESTETSLEELPPVAVKMRRRTLPISGSVISFKPVLGHALV